MSEILEITDFLSKYKISEKDNKPTFLQIAHFPRRETVWSNIIRFFLDDKYHGMNGFLLECIFNCLKNSEFEKVGKVILAKCEEYTEPKRIDIFVKTEDYCFFIENKVDASVRNDLNNYFDHIHKTPGKKRYFGIVLGFNLDKNEIMHNCELNEKYIKDIYVLDYADLVENIKTNIFKVFTVDNKHLLFFIDFIENIRKVMEGSMMDNEFYKLFLDNETKIREINKKFEDLKSSRNEITKKYKMYLETKYKNEKNDEVCKISIVSDSIIRITIKKQNTDTATEFDICCWLNEIYIVFKNKDINFINQFIDDKIFKLEEKEKEFHCKFKKEPFRIDQIYETDESIERNDKIENIDRIIDGIIKEMA